MNFRLVELEGEEAVDAARRLGLETERSADGRIVLVVEVEDAAELGLLREPVVSRSPTSSPWRSPSEDPRSVLDAMIAWLSRVRVRRFVG
ncbi:MAG: hypothetical protein H6737_23175 [Alphaproteobacteria bacterium]|nr:hypothetical protein [Alphaproteobacteria bacterium]